MSDVTSLAARSLAKILIASTTPGGSGTGDGTVTVNSPIPVASQQYSGSSNTTITFTEDQHSFVISNDGNADLTITINGNSYTVKAGEVFEENFQPFTSVAVVTSVAYRALGRKLVGFSGSGTVPITDTTPPSNVTGLVASNVAATNLTLTWSAVSDASAYDVYNGSTLLSTVTGVIYNVTGLTASTNYTFTVKAKDAANNVSSGTSVTQMTTSVSSDTTAPGNVTGLTAGSITQTTLTLSWTAATDNVAVTGYDVYRGTTLLGTVSVTNFNVTGLTASTNYTFTVKARDLAGNVASGASVSPTTSAAAGDTTPPPVPAGLTATAGDTQVSLSWTAVTNPGDLAGYRIFRGGTQIVASQVGTTYTDTGRTNGTLYSYTVASVDTTGNVSAQSTAASATPAPAVAVVSDTFDRANGALGVADTGQTWEQFNGTTVIASNKAVWSNGTPAIAYINSGLNALTGFRVTCDIFLAEGNDWTIILCCDGSGGNRIMIQGEDTMNMYIFSTSTFGNNMVTPTSIDTDMVQYGVTLQWEVIMQQANITVNIGGKSAHFTIPDAVYQVIKTANTKHGFGHERAGSSHDNYKVYTL